jgi:flagellar biosynthesis/type III secretory pathway M-ring protein FliF/YscJ
MDKIKEYWEMAKANPKVSVGIAVAVLIIILAVK